MSWYHHNTPSFRAGLLILALWDDKKAGGFAGQGEQYGYKKKGNAG
jgi:hypothetical protein